MSEKIVVLNSGGFDSIVLMNCLHMTGDYEIHSLHFHYGAKNEVQQQRCVENVCEKVGAKSVVIDLPQFEWTKSDFFNDGYEFNSQYLEYRNLIFLSYALSYAEAVGAKKIYLAVLTGGQYTDTNEVFFEGINHFSKPNSGIEIVTPFIQLTKLDLISYAIQAKVNEDDFFSCDDPDEYGRPCGKCFDCKALEIIKEVIKVDHPMKAFYQSGYDFADETFKKLLSEVPLYEVRALINNGCQLSCEHCFYGFQNMKSEKLSKEEYYKVLKELVLEHGVKNIHFSGKEPLLTDDILWYAKQIRMDNLPCTFNIVTNGINVPLYAKQLKTYGVERIFLSVDDIAKTNGVRKVHGVTDKAMKACEEFDIPVEVFIDLHQNNYNKISKVIEYLYKHYKVKKFFVRTIRSLGNANDQTLLNGAQLDVVWEQLKTCAEKYEEQEFEFSVSIEYLDTLEGTQLDSDILDCVQLYTERYRDNLIVHAEEYCNRYAGTITLTPDGYVLGCASEVSCPNYDEVSVGNVRDTSISELLEKGKSEAYKCNDHFIGDTNLCCSCKKFC